MLFGSEIDYLRMKYEVCNYHLSKAGGETSNTDNRVLVKSDIHSNGLSVRVVLVAQTLPFTSL